MLDQVGESLDILIVCRSRKWMEMCWKFLLEVFTDGLYKTLVELWDTCRWRIGFYFNQQELIALVKLLDGEILGLLSRRIECLLAKNLSNVEPTFLFLLICPQRIAEYNACRHRT